MNELVVPLSIKAPSEGPGAFCAARIIRVVGPLPWTIGGQLVQPIDDLAVTAAPFDQAGEPIGPGTVTLGASHAQAIELAEQIAKYDCAAAGHGPQVHAENKAAIMRFQLLNAREWWRTRRSMPSL